MIPDSSTTIDNFWTIAHYIIVQHSNSRSLCINCIGTESEPKPRIYSEVQFKLVPVLMSIWWFTVYLLMAGFTLLLIISLPVPCSGSLELWFDRHRRGFVKRVLGMHVLSIGDKGIRLIDAIFFFSAVLFLSEILDIQREQIRPDYTRTLNISASKLRAQRNFWISLLNLTVYYCLSRFTSLVTRNITLRELVDANKSSKKTE